MIVILLIWGRFLPQGFVLVLHSVQKIPASHNSVTCSIQWRIDSWRASLILLKNDSLDDEMFGLVCKNACHQAWYPEFNSQDPCSGIRKLTFCKMSSDLHTSPVAHGHTPTHPHPHLHAKLIKNHILKDSLFLTPPILLHLYFLCSTLCNNGTLLSFVCLLDWFLK